MAKIDKAIPEEILIADAPQVIQELIADQSEETAEQKQAREAREDYERRNAEALTARRDVLERNGLVYEEHTVTGDSIPTRCC